MLGYAVRIEFRPLERSERDKAREQDINQGLMNVVTRAPSNILNTYTIQQFRRHPHKDSKLSAIIFTFFALREQTQHVTNGARRNLVAERVSCASCACTHFN